MSFSRKALFVSTGGISRLAGVHTNSKKERAAKGIEKQNKLTKKELRTQKEQLKVEQDIALATSLNAEASTLSTPAIPAPAPAVDPTDQLHKLAELHDSGLLTDEEFESKRSVLVGQL